jgi:glutathione S-transferase
MKVLKKMTELGLDFVFRSHDFSKGEDSWGFKIGGKTQVPLLVDQSKNVVMYESNDIIDYLESNYGN